MVLQSLDRARDRDNMLASVRSRPMARPAAEACGYPPPLVLRLAQRPGAAGPAGLSRWAREHRLSCGSMGPALADRKALSSHRRRCEAVCRYPRTAIAGVRTDDPRLGKEC